MATLIGSSYARNKNVTLIDLRDSDNRADCYFSERKRKITPHNTRVHFLKELIG